jgi:hypothetical protein
MASISGTTRSGRFSLDQPAQRGRVAHGDGVRVVRHLLPRRVGVAVHGNRLHTQALQCNQHLLSQFAAAQQHDAGGVG